MPANLTIITGNPEGSSWSQVHEVREKVESPNRGNLIICLSVSVADEVTRVSLGKEILQRIEEEYFGNNTLTLYNSLKATLEVIQRQYKDHQISVVAVSVFEGVVFAAAVGFAKVEIYRDRVLSKILESGDSTVVVSGHSKEGDVLIIGTKAYFEMFDESEIKKALDTGVEEAVESLTPLLHMDSDTSSVAGAFVSFSSIGMEGMAISTKIPEQESVPREVKRKRFRDRFSKKSLYISKTLDLPPEDTKRKKVVVSVGILLILLLTVSIIFGSRKKSESETLASYESRLVEAQRNLDAAQELLGVSPERAREEFINSRKVMEELVAEGVVDERLDSLKSDIDFAEGKILGVYEITPKLFLDLGLLSEGFSGEDMAVSNDNLYVLDADGEKIVESTFGSKKSEVVAGPAVVNNAREVGAYSGRVFAETDKGIEEVVGSRELVIEDLPNEIIFDVYAGNIYVLDSGGSQITRYPGLGTGFGTGKSWLKEDSESDLSKVISMSIDGNIWLLNNEGKIFKFSLGNQVNFSAKGVAPSLTSPKEIYTNEEMENIYILDPTNSRIVAIDKEGIFVAQYSDSLIGSAIDFGVSEEEKKVVLLTGDKLYEIELRHLE